MTGHKQAARRQFHEIFSNGLFVTGLPEEAAHAEPLAPDMIWDIMKNLHEDYPLTIDEIDQILTLGGFYNEAHQLWFKCPSPRAVPLDVVSAMSVYLKQNWYVEMKLTKNLSTYNSALLFAQYVCLDVPTRNRVPQAFLFEMYLEWCLSTGFAAMSRKAFRTAVKAAGIAEGKGYCDKRSGVAYYLVEVNMSEEVWNGQSIREKEEKEEGNTRAYAAKSLMLEPGRGAQVLAQPSHEEEEGVFGDPAGENCDGRHENNEYDDEDAFESNVPYDGKPAGTDYSAEDGFLAEDELRDSSRSSLFEGSGAGSTLFGGGADRDERIIPKPVGDFETEPGELISAEALSEVAIMYPEKVRETMKTLSTDIRKFFKLMKVTYLINPDNFGLDDFDEYYSTSGLAVLPRSETVNLYHLFVQYCALR